MSVPAEASMYGMVQILRPKGPFPKPSDVEEHLLTTGRSVTIEHSDEELSVRVYGPGNATVLDLRIRNARLRRCEPDLLAFSGYEAAADDTVLAAREVTVTLLGKARVADELATAE